MNKRFVSTLLMLLTSPSAFAQTATPELVSRPALDASTTMVRRSTVAGLPAVTIREFRSSVPEITSRGATDMFMTALIKTRKFRVLERARLADGFEKERALNQQGATTGEVAKTQFVGAAYIFEATVSEMSPAAESNSFGITIAGIGRTSATTKDTIAIDVRVIDIESGIAIDAIEVRRDIFGEETTVGGSTAGLLNAISNGKVGAIGDALAPTFERKSARKEGVDRALRFVIDEAVIELAKRFGTDSDQPTQKNRVE